MLLLAISGWVWRQRRAQAWLAFGWLWFLGTLVPVIGIMQVGAQAMADRYMYFPILGVLTALVWSGAAAVAHWPRARLPLAFAAVAALGALAFGTARQVPAWKNSITLYERSIAAGEDNAAVRYLLAVAFQAAGRPVPEVVAQYQQALKHRPDYMTQLAVITLTHGRIDEARQLIEASIRAEPNNANLHQNLGAFFVRLNRPDDAVPHFEQALRLSPKLASAHLELGQIRLKQNRVEEGRAHYEARARAEPWNADALADYGIILANLQRPAEARPFLERALWIQPGHPRARQML